jgi:hypothetical protein
MSETKYLDKLNARAEELRDELRKVQGEISFRSKVIALAKTEECSGLSRNKQLRLNKEAFDLYERGMSKAEISRHVGVSHTTVSNRILGHERIKSRENRQHPIITPQSRIEELNFSVRTINCLLNAGIQTVESLSRKTEFDLWKLRNFGKRSLHEVQVKLFENNMFLNVP